MITERDHGYLHVLGCQRLRGLLRSEGVDRIDLPTRLRSISFSTLRYSKWQVKFSCVILPSNDKSSLSTFFCVNSQYFRIVFLSVKRIKFLIILG